MAEKTATKLTCEILTPRRRAPLRISRGISAGSCIVWVRIASEGIEGWGEAGPFSTGTHTETREEIEDALDRGSAAIRCYGPLERQRITGAIRSGPGKTSSAAMAAIDTALLDWLGKKVNLPLWRLWGLDIADIPPTSVTIGISEPEAAAERVRDWLQGEMSAEKLFPGRGGGFRVLKVKLGSPEGIRADKAMLDAVVEEAGHTDIIVDANAGWSLEDASEMCIWLHKKGIKLLEQPLAAAGIEDWRRLHAIAPLKIFADESCLNAEDVCYWADAIDGVVIKMMKCGGLSEAFSILNTARSCGLLVMLGCYSDSTLSNSAMAQIAPMVDYVDLDSHFNLTNDPFRGAYVRDGRLIPDDLPGIGVTLRET